MTDTREGAPAALSHVNKVAVRLGLSETQTRGLVEKGELRATKVGRRTYVLVESVDEYLERIGSAS